MPKTTINFVGLSVLIGAISSDFPDALALKVLTALMSAALGQSFKSLAWFGIAPWPRAEDWPWRTQGFLEVMGFPKSWFLSYGILYYFISECMVNNALQSARNMNVEAINESYGVSKSHGGTPPNHPSHG